MKYENKANQTFKNDVSNTTKARCRKVLVSNNVYIKHFINNKVMMTIYKRIYHVNVKVLSTGRLMHTVTKRPLDVASTQWLSQLTKDSRLLIKHARHFIFHYGFFSKKNFGNTWTRQKYFHKILTTIRETHYRYQD